MLQAVLFVIRSVGQALSIYLNIPVKFTDQITVRVYDVLVFLFAIAMFWKLLAMILTHSVSTPWENYAKGSGRYVSRRPNKWGR